MEYRLAIDIFKGDVRCIRQPVLIVTCHKAMPYPKNALLEAVTQGANARAFFLHVSSGKFRCFAKADDRRHILCAAPPASLLMAAANERLKLYALADIKRADPFWTMQLVPGQGEHIDLCSLKIDRDFAHSLHGIGVEQRTCLMRKFGQLPDWEQGTCLIIGPHDRHDCCARPERALIGFDIQTAAPIDANVMNFYCTGFFKVGCKRKDRWMLDGRCNELVAFSLTFERGEDRRVIGLGAPRGKDNLVIKCSTKKGLQIPAGLLHRGADIGPKNMR